MPRRTASRREEAEVRNRADSLAYQTEKFLGENEDKVPEDIKSEVREALAEMKRALESKDTAAVKSAAERVAQVSQKMGIAIYQQAQAGAERRASSDAGEQNLSFDGASGVQVGDHNVRRTTTTTTARRIPRPRQHPGQVATGHPTWAWLRSGELTMSSSSAGTMLSMRS